MRFFQKICPAALAFAALAASPRAEANLTYTIEQFTDSSFTTLIGGYQVVSGSSNPSDSVSFNFNSLTGASTTTPGATLTTLGAGTSGGTGFESVAASNIVIQNSSAMSTQVGSGVHSFTVDNETQFNTTGAGVGPFYFEILVSQDQFVKPVTDPLAFSGNLTVNTVTDSSATFTSTLTTPGAGGGTGTVGPVSLSALGHAPTDSIAVPNGTPGYFSVMSTTQVVLGANSDPNATITLTGQSDVYATPEPSALASALSGLGLFGGLGWLRRRQRRA